MPRNLFGRKPPRATSSMNSVADTASMDDRRMTGRGAWMKYVVVMDFLLISESSCMKKLLNKVILVKR